MSGYRDIRLEIRDANGDAVALQCDLRMAANEGMYGVVQVRRGVMPDGYSHWTLPRPVATERAADLLLTGRMLSQVGQRETALHDWPD